jgi:hypothetical protein
MFGFEKGTKVPIAVVESIELGKFNWDKKKQMQFESNLEKWGCISEDRQAVDLLNYANIYCDRDCHQVQVQVLLHSRNQFTRASRV